MQLPRWHYPLVCNLQTGLLQYDNYNGHWGPQQELNRFLQAYAVEKAKIEARKKKNPANPEPAATCPPTEDQSFQQIADQFAAQLDRHEKARISRVLARLRTEIFPRLRKWGVAKLVADYSGYGDDGCINSLDCFDKQGQPVSLELVGRASDTEIQTLLHELLPDGFETGEGGQGDLTIDLESGTVTLEHGENYTETRASTSRWEV